MEYPSVCRICGPTDRLTGGENYGWAAVQTDEPTNDMISRLSSPVNTRHLNLSQNKN